MNPLRAFFQTLSRLLVGLWRKAKEAFLYATSFVDSILGSIPSLLRANGILEKKKDEAKVDPAFRKIPNEGILEIYSGDIRRLATIEEKARATVVGISVAASLLPATVLLTDNKIFITHDLSAAIIVLWTVTFFFFCTSGLLAFLVLSPIPVYQLRLKDHPAIVGDDKNRDSLILAIALNELSILQKANQLSASMSCLRNAVISLCLFVPLFLYILFF